MKKLLAVLLTVCLLSTLWIAFAAAEDKPTIVVNTFAQEHETAMYEDVIRQFEEENNCIVDFRVSGDQYWPELEASLTAGNAPDVFYLGVGDVRKRVWTGAVAALDEAGITHGVDKDVIIMGFDCNKWALRELLAGNWNYDGQCSPFQAQVISDMIQKLEAGEEIEGLNDKKQIISVEKGFDAREITEEDIDTYGLGE